MDKMRPREKLPQTIIQAKKVASRSKSTRVKTARGRKISSTRWLQRQLNDPYVEAAKQAGYRSRATFKLLHIQEKYNLIKEGMTVIDLGATPGGWSQICATLTKSHEGTGKVLALDIQDMSALPGVDFIKGDFSDPDILLQLIHKMDKKADILLSDMAPFTIGVKAADQIRILNLVEEAIDFSLKVLKPNGHFISKLFEGGGGDILSAKMKVYFDKVHYFKPKSSRSDSSEIFLIGIGFKG